jgi:competence protein ComEC
VGGLVLGADEDLSEEAREAFRASGLAHVLAVSGQNVALLAAFLAVLVWLAGGTRRTAQLASIAAIALYVGVVGPSPSVVRAGVAGGLTAAAWLVSRAADRWHLLAAGALVLLVDNPYAVRDPGFQLSFAAVVAILTLVPRLGRSLDGAPLPRWLRAPLAVSVACTLATAPIGYAHFGRVSVAAAVPANVAALPAVAPILWLGLTAAAVRPVAPGAAARVASLARLPARYLLLVARAGAALDRAVAARRLPLAAGTVAAGVGVALLAGPPFRQTSGCR